MKFDKESLVHERFILP
ncbi:MAG: hypothetical protein R2860_04920 [Desulfobacterales bacterium]